MRTFTKSLRVLDRHAPIKTKVRGNNGPFTTKALSKEIMHISKLKTNFNKKPTEENKRLYKKRRNFCVALLKKEKRNYYNNLDLRISKDNKKNLADRKTTTCLTIMIEVWKKALDCQNSAGAVRTDLSKAFGCLNLDLLIAELDAYGFEKNAINFIYDYLKE